MNLSKWFLPVTLYVCLETGTLYAQSLELPIGDDKLIEEQAIRMTRIANVILLVTDDASNIIDGTGSKKQFVSPPDKATLIHWVTNEIPKLISEMSQHQGKKVRLYYSFETDDQVADRVNGGTRARYVAMAAGEKFITIGQTTTVDFSSFVTPPGEALYLAIEHPGAKKVVIRELDTNGKWFEVANSLTGATPNDCWVNDLSGNGRIYPNIRWIRGDQRRELTVFYDDAGTSYHTWDVQSRKLIAEVNPPKPLELSIRIDEGTLEVVVTGNGAGAATIQESLDMQDWGNAVSLSSPPRLSSDGLERRHTVIPDGPMRFYRVQPAVLQKF